MLRALVGLGRTVAAVAFSALDVVDAMAVVGLVVLRVLTMAARACV